MRQLSTQGTLVRGQVRTQGTWGHGDMGTILPRMARNLADSSEGRVSNSGDIAFVFT